MKIVVEEYINHITPTLFKLARSTRQLPERALVPAELDGRRVQPALPLAQPRAVELSDRRRASVPIGDTLFNTDDRRRATGSARFRGRLRPAGRPDRPRATPPPELWEVEAASIAAGARRSGCARYNDYRELAGFPRVTRVRPDHQRPARARGAARLYGTSTTSSSTSVCSPRTSGQRRRPAADRPHGRRSTRSRRLYTNPLLAPRIFNEETFSAAGHGDHPLHEDAVAARHRNVPSARRVLREPDAQGMEAGMTGRRSSRSRTGGRRVGLGLTDGDVILGRSRRRSVRIRW